VTRRKDIGVRHIAAGQRDGMPSLATGVRHNPKMED